MRRYLVVDDNRPFAANLGEILRDAGDSVECAWSGAQALQLIRQSRFDALVTDMKMPGMGGAELVHASRRVDPGLPAIVVTGYAGNVDLDKVLREGVLSVLAKPAPMPQLLETLRSARRDGFIAVVVEDPLLRGELVAALAARGFTPVARETESENEGIEHPRLFAAIVDSRAEEGPQGVMLQKLRLRFPDLVAIVVAAVPQGIDPTRERENSAQPFDPRAVVEELEARFAREHP